MYDKKFLDYVMCKHSSKNKLKRFDIPVKEIGEVDSFQFVFLKRAIEDFYDGNVVANLQWYNEEKIIQVSEYSMLSKEKTFVFPYEEYDQFYSVIKEINDFDDLTMVTLFVNNIPYSLEAGIVVASESHEILNEVRNVALKNNMTENHHLGFKEIMKRMAGKQYNLLTMTGGKSVEQIESQISPLFLLPPKSSYEADGYKSATIEKSKLFVSYCHKDKELVNLIIEKLRNYGLDFWIDEEQIDVGDRLMERINEGILESDLPIIFLSGNTKEAMYAKHELMTFFSKIIYQRESNKNWFIVRLDAINPDEVALGLGSFKYFDYPEETIENLAEAILKKLS